MDIKKSYYLDGAKNAQGLAVIIDVFRAFSTACYIYGSGAERIILAASPEQALALKQDHPGYVLIGEKNARMVDGFDYGNSPCSVEKADLTGKTAVLMTSAGTRGVLGAGKADEVLTGSFVNAGSIAEYILRNNPQKVSLVCMGWNANQPADEDDMCAEFIKTLIVGAPSDFKKIFDFLKFKSVTKSFLGLGGEKSAPAEDFDLCLALDRFGFVLKAEGGELKKVYPSKIPAAS